MTSTAVHLRTHRPEATQSMHATAHSQVRHGDCSITA